MSNGTSTREDYEPMNFSSNGMFTREDYEHDFGVDGASLIMR